ncbi:hypothetical protein, conserved [Eimeria maxima]|uniref:Uncharacterized protein n=1 Tax=Eimeria maxima TaxID=5804 RepID=U6MBP5_EIMMA|nr:hypothetical protein, conserved [Eimeria maxima]CDJ59060.1 hypothetical protein, conserved [Eimeria maxima]
MPTFGHAHGIFCALHESTARNTGYGWGTAEVAATAGRLDAHTRAAACAPRSSIGQLHRQYPAGFASVVAAVASTGQLQLLQDPLWLAAVGAAQAWQHSTNVKTPRTTEAARMSAAAEEGSSVAEAIRDAALETGGEDPLLRLQLAVLLGEAAALLHSIGEALAASSLRKSVGGHKSTVLGSEDSQRMAVAAGRSAYELELWHIRLTALPVSVSVVSLGSREGVPWKPRPCGALSAVAAKPLLQQTAATDELLLLNQQVRLAIRFLTTLASCALEKIQPLHLRCMQALQQAQQLAFQLALPGEAVTAGMPAKAAPELAAAADTSTSCPDTCGDVGLPPPISLTSRPHYSKMNWQLLLTGRGLLAAPGE